MTKAELQKRIRWAEEHMERAIATAREDQQKYPGSKDRWAAEEAGLQQALFVFRCFLNPEHPDVKRVEAERGKKEAA